MARNGAKARKAENERFKLAGVVNPRHARMESKAIADAVRENLHKKPKKARGFLKNFDAMTRQRFEALGLDIVTVGPHNLKVVTHSEWKYWASQDTEGGGDVRAESENRRSIGLMQRSQSAHVSNHENVRRINAVNAAIAAGETDAKVLLAIAKGEA